MIETITLPTNRRIKRRWHSFFTYGLVFGFAFFGFCLASTMMSYVMAYEYEWNVVVQSSQPPGLNYKSFDPYAVLVIERRCAWTWLGSRPNYYVHVGHGIDTRPTYGLYLEYKFFAPGEPDLTASVKKSNVEWDPDGITLVEASGFRYFIPKARFVGGR